MPTVMQDDAATFMARTHDTLGHCPIRTCIASGVQAPSSQLLRLVCRKHDGQAVILADHRARLHGRGAWITPTLEAYSRAQQRRAFQRAFRVSDPVDTSDVLHFLTQRREATKASPTRCKE